MSGHTPRPWRSGAILSGSENDKGFRVIAPDGRNGWTWIADVSPVIDNERGEASEEGKANARLIAAAPELLAGLKHLRYSNHGYWPSACDACKVAESAIAKAEGK